jgi:hypothetical protein
MSDKPSYSAEPTLYPTQTSSSSGGVPYPEGYIPSITQKMIQQTKETIVPQQKHKKTAEEYTAEYLKKLEEPRKKILRAAGGEVWQDPTLEEWDSSKFHFLMVDDFRIFCGDLGKEVNDDMLSRAFSKYPSFAKAKVIRDKRTLKTKGYGFVSFTDPNDFVLALKEMNGKKLILIL